MTKAFDPKTFLNKLKLPEANHARLSFCPSNKPAKVALWVGELRATQITHTSIILYKYLPEVGRLKTDFKTRFEILETVRPCVQNCILGLTKEFLNQPIVLPESAQKMAIIAQALQKSMVDAYIACIREITQQKRVKGPVLEILAHALHRAITGTGLLFFRSYQLYTQTPPGMWEVLHGLYQVAASFNLLSENVPDSLLYYSRASKLQDAYIRILMLSTMRSNQLSQADVDQAYKCFERWSQNIKLFQGEAANSDNLYLVNLDADAPPCYKSRFEGSESDHVLEIDFKPLLNQLDKLGGNDINEVGNTILSSKDEIQISPTLLEHLVDTWVNAPKRKHERRNISASAEICIGLIDCHYFVSGQKDFEDQIQFDLDDLENNIITNLAQNTSDAQHSDECNRPCHKISIQNVSAGGYCILWKNDNPAKLVAGELIGIREDGRHSWSIGVVRWVKQLKKACQFGVLLLSAHPKPLAVTQTHDMGGYTDFMRALSLPKGKFGDAPASILTSVAPFQEFNKISIIDGDQLFTVKLESCLFSTRTIKQFSYTKLND